MKDISLKVSLLCPVCGFDQFSSSDDSELVVCSDCGFQCSEDELVMDNSELIDAGVESVSKQIEQQILKSLKGNKYLKFK